MSPNSSAFAAPGIERAIININGFFPFDIIYSGGTDNTPTLPVEAVPIELHGSTRANRMRRNPPLDTSVFKDFDAVHACLSRAVGSCPRRTAHVIQSVFRLAWVAIFQ